MGRFTPSAETTALQLKRAGVIAIIRARSTHVALERGKELISIGCAAIEVLSVVCKLCASAF